MDDEERAVTKMLEGQIDEEVDAEVPEKALTPAEIDLLHESGLFSLFGDVIREVVEDARVNALSPNQIEAAALVAMGLNDTEIASLVGVTRQTVNLWKNHNFFFMEEVERKRAEIWESYKVQFRTMIPRAMEVMSKALDDSDKKTRMEAATFILRSVMLEPIALEKRKLR